MVTFLSFFFSSHVYLLLGLFFVLASEGVSNRLFLWLKLPKNPLKAVHWNTCITATCFTTPAMPEHMVSFNFRVAVLWYFSRLCLNFLQLSLINRNSLLIHAFFPSDCWKVWVFIFIILWVQIFYCERANSDCVSMQSEACQLQHANQPIEVS